MRFEVSFNGSGYVDYTIKEDGTLVSGPEPSRAVLVTYIRVLTGSNSNNGSASINNSQAFALFALIMQLHKALNNPIVTGDLTWDEVVKGAK
jgi:hypothetical protein